MNVRPSVEPGAEWRGARAWTPDEATAALPLVRRIVDDLMLHYGAWRQAIEAFEHANAGTSDAHAEAEPYMRVAQGLAGDIDGFRAELSALDVRVMRADSGPAVGDSATVHPEAIVRGNSIVCRGASVGARALVLDSVLLPGSALGNKLRDQGYRILHLTEAARLVSTAEQEKPLVAFVDLEWKAGDACAAIAALKSTPATAHVPILAFSSPKHTPLQAAALAAGATIIASDEAILAQLPAMLDQAMVVE